MANKPKKCSGLLAIMEMAVKTIMRFHLTEIKMARKQKSVKAGEDIGGKLPQSCIAGNVN